MEDDQSDELPFRAEYAKSNRSTCKACKTQIIKDSLRLAVLVQSPVFDGKVPNWYHFECFFGKQRPKTVGDIAHFDSLRWEDQEKIKGKIGENPETVLKAIKSGDKKATKRAIDKAVKSLLKDFVVEYAKSSRAMCRGCEVKISKGEIRISKKDYESEGARMYGGQDRWHHVECFTKLRDELAFYESGENIPGFDLLKSEDKEIVKKALPKVEGKKDEVDGVSSEKKIKKEEKEENKIDDKELKKQNDMMFKYRDSLTQLTRTQLTELFKFNDQEDPAGVDRKLDRLADVMTFGALQPCTQCKTGQFVYRTGIGYQCTGDLTEWTKCPNVEKEPKRTKFKIPETLAEEFPFLDKYKCKIGTRLIPAVKSSASQNSDGASTSAKVERFAPFRGMSFFIIGKTSQKKPILKKKIESWGGNVSSKLTSDVALVISSKAEIEKNDSKMVLAQNLDIPVVPESYIQECSNGNAVDKITDLAISSWGLNPKDRIQRIVNKSLAQSKSGHSKSRFEKSGASKVTVKLKGGLAVDPESGLEDIAHVYVNGKDIYSVVLGYTDVKSNKNSFYKLQILLSDSSKQTWLFRSWGRIGTKIGGSKLDTMSDLHQAKAEFRALYLEKTGNDFRKRDEFVKMPDCMYPIDIDYGQSDSLIKLSSESKIQSKLTQSIQDLVKMLFDVDIMQKVMMEFELDLEKMPLGKLSKKQIQKAYGVLSDLQKSDGDIKPMMVVEASNRFYTLIPHDFGVRSPPLLDNKDIIQAKLEMLESLLEMEVAYSLLRETNSEGDDSLNPIDAHYAKLNTDIEVLDRDSEEFKLIQEYVKNTHAVTHSSYSLEIIEVFKAKRNGEEKRFKPFKKLHNRKLLWHGSRVTNFAGILSQGLRIAPPEAPVTGYMFGKGIYFADMVSKSANYCMTSPVNPYGLLLLCEVALGDMYERTKADYIEKLPPGKHSTKGIGLTTPDPKQAIITPEGVEIPLGKGISCTKQGSLLYNEYIVYDVAQVKVQYLLKMKFNYIH